MPSFDSNVRAESAAVTRRHSRLASRRPARAASSRALTVQWARTQEDVREAQRLRFDVFAVEMGARLSPPAGSPPGLDIDRFDAFCDHLLVRAGGHRDGEVGTVVGTYRVLSPDRALAAGGYYTDSEFDLTPLAALRRRAVELGRSCVHADWRTGGVIMAMWSALARYMVERRLETVIGCASVSLGAGMEPAVALWQELRRTHLAEARWHVQPLHALPDGTAFSASGGYSSAEQWSPEAPPLLKGYLRCGGRLLGPPALDEAFNTADFPVMLRLADMAPRYRTHFLPSA